MFSYTFVCICCLFLCIVFMFFFVLFVFYFLLYLSELCYHAREISSYWKRSVVLNMRSSLNLCHFEENVSKLNSLAVCVVFCIAREERWNDRMMIDEIIIIPNMAESLQRFPVFSFYSRNGEPQLTSFMSMNIEHYHCYCCFQFQKLGFFCIFLQMQRYNKNRQKLILSCYVDYSWSFI